jgi:sugar/nucleoside kinase (ribokinase family)
MLAGEYNLRKAAAAIAEMGPKTLVIKRGEHGAILWHGEQHFMAPGYLLDDVFDPTGAGDCFAGGFMGYLASEGVDLRNQSDGVDPNLLRRAVIYGSVMGSFCCERFGVERFRTLSRSEIDVRFEEFKAFTAF